LSGLPANTTLHYRLEVRTDFGSRFGADRTFTTLRATHLTIGASRTITEGTTVTIATRLTDVASGKPLGGRKVGLFARHTKTGAWIKVATRTTSSTGHAIVAQTPRRFTQYEWRFAGDSAHGSTVSAIQSITVKSG